MFECGGYSSPYFPISRLNTVNLRIHRPHREKHRPEKISVVHFSHSDYNAKQSFIDSKYWLNKFQDFHNFQLFYKNNGTAIGKKIKTNYDHAQAEEIEKKNEITMICISIKTLQHFSYFTLYSNFRHWQVRMFHATHEQNKNMLRLKTFIN